MAVDATRTGMIDVYLGGPAGAKVTVGERVAGRVLPVATTTLNEAGLALLRGAATWRCDRRARHLVAAQRLPDGTLDTISSSVRTPSCRDRLRIAVRRRVRPGAKVPVRVSDRWRIGRVSARVCLLAPNGESRCLPMLLAPGHSATSRSIRLGARGRWRIELRTRYQRLRAPVLVGIRDRSRPRRPGRPPVLLTGDSLMQNVDTFLSDMLHSRERTVPDIKVGTGISKTGFSWPQHARRQAARVRPHAVIVFLGANEGASMRASTGMVEC